MRDFSTLSKIALSLTGVWMAIGVPIHAIATEQAVISPQVVIAEPSTPINLLNYTEYHGTAVNSEPIKIETLPSSAPTTDLKCDTTCGAPTCAPTCGAPTCNPVCPHWILGVEAVWLSPQQQTRPYAHYDIESVDHVISYDYDGGVVSGLFITPRITLGYQGPCWGIQTRYWRMNEASNQFIPPDGPNFTTENYDRLFKAETLDLEVTRMFCWHDTTNQLSFGVRYAQLEQSANLSVIRQFGEHTEQYDTREYYLGSALSRSEFSGAGLTVGWTGYKPLGCSRLNLFYSMRGSFIWDSSAHNLVETKASYLYPTAGETAGSFNGAETGSPADMYIGEFQLGVQWNFELVCHRADAFVRLALEYQFWETNNTGFAWSESFAGNADFVGRPSAVTGTAVAASGDNRTDLIGFTIATGFTW